MPSIEAHYYTKFNFLALWFLPSHRSSPSHTRQVFPVVQVKTYSYSNSPWLLTWRKCFLEFGQSHATTQQWEKRISPQTVKFDYSSMWIQVWVSCRHVELLRIGKRMGRLLEVDQQRSFRGHSTNKGHKGRKQ